MNKKIILALIIVIAVLVSGYYFFLRKSEPVKLVEPTNISSQINAVNGQLVDVRTIEESHVKGAINVPVEDILSGKYLEIDKDRPVYVYCRSGRRSAQAKEKLESVGYSEVIDIGGLDDLKFKGGMFCKGDKKDC